MQMTDSLMLLTQMFTAKDTQSFASSQQSGRQEENGSFRDLIEQRQPASKQQSARPAQKPAQNRSDEAPQDAPAQTTETLPQTQTDEAIPTLSLLPTLPTVATALPDGQLESALLAAPQAQQMQTQMRFQAQGQLTPHSLLPQQGQVQTAQTQQPFHSQFMSQAQPQTEGQQMTPMTDLKADLNLTQPQKQTDLGGFKSLAGDKALFSSANEPNVTLAEEAPAQPLFQKLEGTPIKVGQTQTADAEAPDFTQQLAKQVNTALEKGAQRVEIQLTPAHLGKLTIELTRAQDGSMRLVLHASTERAANLLSEHSSGLASLLRGNSQSPVQVEIQQQNQEQGQREQQQQQQQQSNQQHHQQRQQQQQAQDFLQQLRLGILPFEVEAS